MSHANARLNVHGRRLLVDRVRRQGWAVAHAAKAMGISRQCAHRWVARFDAEGEAGLADRSSRPHASPTRTPAAVEAAVVAARCEHRRGQDWLGPELGLAPRTAGRVLRLHHVPYLRHCDPLTGAVIRSSRSTAVRYERERPGELVHVDVKKIGRIPDGGGWKAHGRAATNAAKRKRPRIGYDYVHSMVDDHCRLAYSEIHPDETAITCAAFLTRAIAYFAEHGIPRIERVMTDNAFAYRHEAALSVRSWPRPARGRSSSSRTARGRTGRSNGSTGPWPASGPAGRCSPATPNEPPHLHPGSSTTTLDGATPHSRASHQRADCHQRPDRIHLGRPLDRDEPSTHQVIHESIFVGQTPAAPAETQSHAADRNLGWVGGITPGLKGLGWLCRCAPRAQARAGDSRERKEVRKLPVDSSTNPHALGVEHFP